MPTRPEFSPTGRDSFGKPEEIAGYALAPAIRLTWVEDGDRSFKPRKHSGRTRERNLDRAAAAIVGSFESPKAEGLTLEAGGRDPPNR